nr:hypothetical protein [Pseudactinotalea sp. HY158]
MRWSSAAKVPSLIRRRRVGWPMSRQAKVSGSPFRVRQQTQFLELFGGEQVGLVEDEDDGAAAFVFLGGQQVGGLGDEAGLVEARDGAEGGDDLAVDASAADGGVAYVDGGVPGGVQCGEGGADGDGLAGADLAGDHAQGAFTDAPGDAGDRFGVGGVAVQHAGGQGSAEGHAGEAVVGLEAVESHWVS